MSLSDYILQLLDVSDEDLTKEDIILQLNANPDDVKETLGIMRSNKWVGLMVFGVVHRYCITTIGKAELKKRILIATE